jgi:hypothetical protein
LMEDGRKIGHTYSHPDLLLAATALHHGLTVVTRDRSDFDKARVPVVGGIKHRNPARVSRFIKGPLWHMPNTRRVLLFRAGAER